MKTTLRVGLMTLVAGGLMVSSIPIIAGEQLDSWKVRGLSRPGTWFASNTAEKPVTIGLKSSHGVGKQKRRILSVIEKKPRQPHPRTPKRKDAPVSESKVISLDKRAEDEEKPFFEQLLQEGARKLLQAAIEKEVMDAHSIPQGST
jgi:hypothetical protein